MLASSRRPSVDPSSLPLSVRPSVRALVLVPPEKHSDGYGLPQPLTVRSAEARDLQHRLDAVTC
jgi:hypothetical protein